MYERKNQSITPEHRYALTEVTWDTITEPGAYVEKGTGDLYRLPKEALMQGLTPLVDKESHGASRLVLISRNPFVTTLEARLRCCKHNIDPNF